MSSHGLSSTLKNLKFMQRSKAKVEKKDVEEENTAVLDSDDVAFISSHTSIKRKCVVIMEGNPLPLAVRGRMSFRGFNPSIDKLNEEAVDCSNPQSSSSNTEKLDCEISGRPQDDQEAIRRKRSTEIDMSSPCSSEQISRKDGTLSEENGKRASNNPRKQRKREKLDWNVLKRPKVQDKEDAI